MRSPSSHQIDLSVLVDIISNVAGMMILLACVSIMIRQKHKQKSRTADRPCKAIDFPLSYIPQKRSLVLCLKNGQLYELPELALLQEISHRTETGKTIQSLSLTEKGVEARLELTPTLTGFRFQYRLLKKGGLPIANKVKLAATLDKIISRYPPKDFFYVIHTWPKEFAAFREIRKFLLERGLEVGWQPHPPPLRKTNPANSWDVEYAMGEYADDLSSIKAQ